MQVAIYARVSSERQEREETVQSQLEALRTYAGAKGYGAPTEFVDEGRSGYDLNRPALDRLRDAVASGAFDVVLVHEISRVARERFDQALLLREFRQRVRVEFVKHPTDNTAEGELIENVLGDFAHFEGRIIADRTRRGRQHWVRQGALVGGGVPYGYRILPRTADRRSAMEVDPAQAEVVREIFRLVATDGLALPRGLQATHPGRHPHTPRRRGLAPLNPAAHADQHRLHRPVRLWQERGGRAATPVQTTRGVA